MMRKGAVEKKSVKFWVFSPKSLKLRSGNFKLPQLAKNDEKLPR